MNRNAGLKSSLSLPCDPIVPMGLGEALRSEKKPLTGSPARDAVMIAACCATLATLVPVALKQTGAVSHLPDPPCSLFNSDSITASPAAHPFGVPDSLPGLASFGTTLALMFAARHSRTARTLLGGKLAADAAFATFNLLRQPIQFRKLCSWCTATGIAALTMAAAGRALMAESGRVAAREIRSL